MFSIWVSNSSSWKKRKEGICTHCSWGGVHMVRKCMTIKLLLQRGRIIGFGRGFFHFFFHPLLPHSFSFLIKPWNSAFQNLSCQPKEGMALWLYYFCHAENDLVLTCLHWCTSIHSYLAFQHWIKNSLINMFKMRRMSCLLIDNQRPVLLSVL